MASRGHREIGPIGIAARVTCLVEEFQERKVPKKKSEKSENSF